MWLICHWDFCRWNIRGFINNWGNVTFWEWWTCHDKERLYKQFGIWICFWFLIVKLNQNINKFGDSIKCKSVTLGEQLGCFPPKIVSSEKANTVEPTDRQTDISYKLCGHIYEAWCSVERRAEGSEGRWCYAISTSSRYSSLFSTIFTTMTIIKPSLNIFLSIIEHELQL